MNVPAFNRALRAEERAFDVLEKGGFLSADQILEHGIELVATRGERATTVTVHIGQDARFMVKLGAPQAQDWSRREITCHRVLHEADMSPAILPDLLFSDTHDAVLVTRLLAPARTLFDHFGDTALHGPPVLDALVSTLIRLHGLRIDPASRLPQAVPWVLSESPDAMADHLAPLFADAGDRAVVLESLAAGLVAWSPETLIHGDLKLDNCLLEDADGTEVRLRLIDWELAGLGDPVWDLATAVQEFLLLAPGGTPDDAQRAAGHLLETYIARADTTGGGKDALFERCGLYIGCRLVQSAFELASLETATAPRVQGAIALARDICADPARALAILFAARA